MDDSPAGRHDIRERDLSGFKYFKQVLGLLERLHPYATARGRAHHRTLFYVCVI